MAEEWEKQMFSSWKCETIRTQNPTLGVKSDKQAYLAGYRQAIEDAAEVANKHWFKHSVSGVVENIAKDIKKLGEE